MPTKTQDQTQIIERLERIEDLLIRVLPQQTELSEDDTAKIIKGGDREYAEGKTENLDVFLKREYSRLAKHED